MHLCYLGLCSLLQAVIKRPQAMNLINQLVGQEQEGAVREDEPSVQEELPAENTDTVKMDIVDDASDQEEIPTENTETVKRDILENDEVDMSRKGIPAENYQAQEEILPEHTESVKMDIVEDDKVQEEVPPEFTETVKRDIVEDASSQEEVQ